MEFVCKAIRVGICISNICISLWFLDNVLIHEGKIRTRTKLVVCILNFLIIMLGKNISIFSAITGYYIVLIIYGVCIKAKINLLNIFFIIKSVSDCLGLFVSAYILAALSKNYSFLEFYNDNSLLRQIIFLFLILFRINVIKIHIKEKVFIENLSDKQLLISNLILIIIQIFLVSILRYNIKFNNIVTINESILATLLFGVNVFFYKILMFLSKEIEEKYLLKMSIKKTELEEIYVKEIFQMYTDIKSWKHDYRNNINVICNLAIANEHDKLLRYIEELDKGIMVAESIVYTGVFIIDSVITSKYLYGNGKGIKFSINTGKIEKANISDFDLNIIFSNLLDNAIEGALKSKEKKIDINIFEINNNIVFKMKNSFDGNIKKINGNYITTKEGNIHGLGINRVKSIVSKYNGFIYVDNDNNVFENKVILPIK